MAGVEAIMAQLVLQEKNNELNVINKRLTNIFNTMSDGVIMIHQNGMITDLNPVVAKIIDVVPGNMGKRSRVSVERLLGDKQAVIRKMLKDKKGFVDIEIYND